VGVDAISESELLEKQTSAMQNLCLIPGLISLALKASAPFHRAVAKSAKGGKTGRTDLQGGVFVEN
jgi:hypothetical protein